MYSKEFIEELKNTIPISMVIGKKVALKKSGLNYQACCPFHEEKTPSFFVSDTKGIYKCFGCGNSGNIFTFIMELENLNFKEAIEYLANDFNIPLPKLEKVKNKDNNEFEKLYELNEVACKFFESQIIKSSIAIDYIKKRKLKIEDVIKFRIGYAPNEFSMLIEYAKNKNINGNDLENAGLVVKKFEKEYYDKFRNRLMFPIIDRKGRVIAFQGRIIGDGMPKYLNSPETKIFIKGNTLFNIYYSDKSIHNNNYAILVEGNMDAISLSVNGFENVVAPMGTGTTIEQIKMLWRSTDNIIVCFDGDDAGQKAMERLAKLVLSIIVIDKNIKFAFLPKNTDPDSFIIKYGVVKFDEIIKNAVHLSEYLWNSEKKFINTDIPEERAVLEKRLDIIVATMNDNRLKEHFKKFYKNKMYGFVKKEIKVETLINTNNKVNIDKIKKIENEILLRFIKFPEILEKLQQESNDIDIFNEDFFSKIKMYQDDSNNLDIKDLLKECGVDFKIFNEWKPENTLEIVEILLMERESELIRRAKNETQNFNEIKILNNKMEEINKKINVRKIKNNFI